MLSRKKGKIEEDFYLYVKLEELGDPASERGNKDDKHVENRLVLIPSVYAA